MEKSVQMDNGKRIVTWEPEDCEEYVPVYIECKNLPEEYDDVVEDGMLYNPVIWGVHTAEAYMEECEILKFSYALWKLLPEVELDYCYENMNDSDGSRHEVWIKFGNEEYQYRYENSYDEDIYLSGSQQEILCSDNFKNTLYRLCGVENFNIKKDLNKELKKLYFELIAQGDELRKKTLIIPEGTKTIKQGEYQKIEEREYKKIVIPKSVEDIHCWAFPARCGKLFEVDKENKFYKAEGNCLIKRNEEGEKVVIYGNDDAMIPEDVDAIGEFSFEGLLATGIVIPKNVTYIGANAFRWSKLEKVNVKGKVKFIACGAFRWCRNLETINLPGSLETVEVDAFQGCPLDSDIISRLKELGYEYIEEEEPEYY